MPVDGVINFRKPCGMTSQSAVNTVKRIFGAQKAGHCGTLDPDASGVLPVMLGKAVRLSEYLTDHDKSYKAFIGFGKTTDTGDAGGKTLSENGYIPPFEEIKRAASSFEGGYEQLPPMYSALKVNGRKLVDAARKGVVLERRPRFVDISRCVAEEEAGGIALYVECSRGTYIRTLCEDIARKAGALGYMGSLCRTRVGAFCIENSVTLDELKNMEECEREKLIIPAEVVLSALPELHLAPFHEKLIRCGCAVDLRKISRTLPQEEREYRLYGENGFFATGKTTFSDGILRLKQNKLFV